MDKQLRRREVAKALGISEQTLYRWEKNGRSPVKPKRLVRTRELLYQESDVEKLRAWMNRTEEAEIGQTAS